MAILTTDIVRYGSALHPEADSGNAGGAISLSTALRRFVQASATIPKMASSNAGDTMNVTIFGRLSTGAADSEVKALNGTTQVAFTKSFMYLTKVTIASAAAGTVTIFMNDGSTQIVQLAPGTTKNLRLFNNSASAAAQTIRYESEYWKNNHGSLTLLSAFYRLTADPSSKIRVGSQLATNQSIITRIAAPGGVAFVDDNVDIDLTSLPAGTEIQFWIEQTLSANDSPYNSTYTTEVRGLTAV